MAMSTEEKEELKNIIKESVQTSVQDQVQIAVHNELGQYKVPKEEHYKQHLFLKEWMEWVDNIKSSFWKSAISTLTKFAMFILFLGFITWLVIFKGGN